VHGNCANVTVGFHPNTQQNVLEINMYRVMQCAFVFMVLVFSAQAEAALGCLDSDVLPAGPSSGSDSVTVDASNTATESFDVVLWRQTCAPNASRLLVRLTPTSGSPIVCTDFHIIQGITQYSVALLAGGGSNVAFCNRLVAPTTFLLKQDTGDPTFNVDAALTLIYSYDARRLSAADLPAVGATAAIAPVVGLWWNPSESGTGYALDVKHQTMVVTVYSYTPAGAPLWYIVVGPIVNNVFIGSLEKFVNGQCISCTYKAPVANGNDGQMTIAFTSPTTGTMTLPGGRSFAVVPQAW
jgi:hypothetical protein